MSIRTGQIVGFIYNKGTNPGTSRVVKVTEADSNHIKGNDIALPDGNQYRQFSRSEMQGVPTIIANENEDIVPLSTLFRKDVSSLKFGELHVKGLLMMLEPTLTGRFIRYNDDFKVAVVKKDIKPHIQLHMTGDKITMVFVNGTGEEMGLSFDKTHSQGYVGLPYRQDCAIDEASLSKFALALPQHLNVAPQPLGSNTSKMTAGDNFFTTAGTHGKV